MTFEQFFECLMTKDNNLYVDHLVNSVIFRGRQEMSRGVLSLRFNQDHGIVYLCNLFRFDDFI